MRKARIAFCSIVLCTAIMLLSGNVVFIHPVFASSLSSPATPTPSPTFTSNVNCPQPPTNIDHATLSDAQLDLYQLPRYRPGSDKAAWKAKVRAMKHHICGGTPTNRRSSFATSMHSANYLVPNMSPSCSSYNMGSDIWAGNVAINSSNDGSCTQNNSYIEADAMFYVPCIKSGSPSGEESSWVGLGGVNNSNLVQAGTESDVSYILGIAHYSYYAWTENTAASNGNQINLFGVNCNDRMQVFISHDGETIVHDWTNGDYNKTESSPSASYATAEWIVERTSSCDIFGNCSPQPLPDYQSETFYGMGATIGGSNYYASPAEFDHGYMTMGSRVYVGPLSYNTLWGPPDFSNTINWVHQ